MAYIGNLTAGSHSVAYLDYRYNDEDDLRSIARWLKRVLAPSGDADSNPSGDEPFIYWKPEEGTFRRPAVTIRLVDSYESPEGQRSLHAPTYTEEHALVITAYGLDRAKTTALAMRLRRAFMEGGHAGTEAWYGEPLSIPMWLPASQTQLARRLRVVRRSLSMGTEQTDEEAQWSRPMELRVRSPRLRLTRSVPIIGSVGITNR